MVDSLTCLGVYSDNKLSWLSHIEHIYSIILRVTELYRLKRQTLCVTSHYLQTAYHSKCSIYF